MKTLKLIEVRGKTLIQKSVNAQRRELDLDHLNSGMYFLELNTEEASRTIRIEKL